MKRPTFRFNLNKIFARVHMLLECIFIAITCRSDLSLLPFLALGQKPTNRIDYVIAFPFSTFFLFTYARIYFSLTYSRRSLAFLDGEKIFLSKCNADLFKKPTALLTENDLGYNQV